MLVNISRDDKVYGTLRCSPAPNDHGEIDTEVWFCPYCGRIYAREQIQFESDEQHFPLIYRVLVRPCYMPLHDVALPHPTFWLSSDKTLLQSALMEHFHDRSPNECPAFHNHR